MQGFIRVIEDTADHPEGRLLLVNSAHIVQAREAGGGCILTLAQPAMLHHEHLNEEPAESFWTPAEIRIREPFAHLQEKLGARG